MKRKLLFAIVALMCSVGTWAQNPGDDMTSYITNPDATTDISGWTASSGDAHRHNGNGFDGNSGFFELCTWGGSWDLSLSQTVEGLPNGYYLVKAAGQMSAVTDAWMKLVANGSESQFCRNGDTNGTINASGQEVAVGSGVAGWRYTGVVAKVTDGTLAISVVGHSDVKERWANFDHVTLTYLGAKIPDNTDLTYAINNHSFETGDLAGWTTGGTSSDTGVKDNSNATYATTGIDGNKLFNTWWQGVPLTQTIANMPNGNYRLTVSVAGSDDGADAKIFLLGEDGHSDVKTITRGTKGTFNDYTYDFTVTDHTVTIGVVGGNDDGTYSANGHWWYKADNFRLKYLGLDLTTFETLLAAAVTKAQTLVDGNTIPDAAETALQAVIDANDNSDNMFDEEDQFTDAINAINAAYDTYKVLETNYAAWLKMKAGADAMVLVANNNATATSTLSDAIPTQNTAAEAATTAEGIATATSSLRAAIMDFVENAVPTSGNRFNLTCLLTNPDLTGMPTWQKADGWYTEQPDGNSQVMQNDSKNNGSYTHFFEYWSDPAKTSGYTLYLKTTLPKGVYSMECQAFAEDQRTDAAKEENPTVNGVTFSANDVDGSEITSTKLDAASISFYQASENEVKLGLKAHTGNTRNWMGIGYVKLFKVANDQAAGVYATVRSSANSALASSDYTNVTGKERSDLATLAAIETPADYVEAIENLQDANSAFVSAKTTYDTWVNTSLTKKITNIGTGVFQLNETTNNSLYSAYETARNHEITSSTTASDVAGWNDAVSTAINNYNNQPLNAPDAGKRYWVTIVDDGKEWNGKAITFIAGGRNDQGNYGVKYLAVTNAYMNQALKFTATTGNKYKVSALNPDGTEQYLTTANLGYEAGTDNTNKERIRTTNDASKALEIEIQATTTDNQFKLYNTDRGAIIANNDNNDVYTKRDANFTIAEASQASVELHIAAGKLATRIFPFTPSLPTGVEAYSCEDNEGASLTFVKVDEPAANTPYILYSENGVSSTDLTGWGTAAADSYEEGYLTGVFTRTEVPQGSYVLQTQNEKQAFYLVNQAGAYSSAYRVYVTVPASNEVKSFGFTLEDVETAIEAARAEGAHEVTLRYNAAGQQMNGTRKGLNIVKMADGTVRKVLVK